MNPPREHLVESIVDSMRILNDRKKQIQEWMELFGSYVRPETAQKIEDLDKDFSLLMQPFEDAKNFAPKSEQEPSVETVLEYVTDHDLIEMERSLRSFILLSAGPVQMLIEELKSLLEKLALKLVYIAREGGRWLSLSKKPTADPNTVQIFRKFINKVRKHLGPFLKEAKSLAERKARAEIAFMERNERPYLDEGTPEYDQWWIDREEERSNLLPNLIRQNLEAAPLGAMNQLSTPQIIQLLKTMVKYDRKYSDILEHFLSESIISHASRSIDYQSGKRGRSPRHTQTDSKSVVSKRPRSRSPSRK